MKSITINGSKRESVGKSSSRLLRNAGQVPCVLYGGEGPIHFSAPELAFSKLVYTANAYTVVIAFGEKESYNAILQDIQFHPVSDKILHIDFYQLFDDKKISMDIPVKVSGNPIGVKLGGNLQRNKRKLRIKALPTNLPDNIEIDIAELNIGDKVYITQLFNENYEFLHPDNTVVCQVRRARAALVVETEEGEGEEGEEGAEEGSEGTPKESESTEGKESSEAKED
ncbi:MAG: 50S ribosomal protein L25/general stress protein Ctc [Bacteroidetes bacterium MED-G13]|nr:MAG: 50S ribosomal protein L25/general stress protein Ctc [Bacteroidetes bacterium MED-G13]|tara:strand:- start:19054 stop:19731 length:678 start_codon:yes stop_codon:yes gene_type:complete